MKMPKLFMNQVFESFQSFKAIFEQYTSMNFIIWVVYACETLENDSQEIKSIHYKCIEAYSVGNCSVELRIDYQLDGKNKFKYVITKCYLFHLLELFQPHDDAFNKQRLNNGNENTLELVLKGPTTFKTKKEEQLSDVWVLNKKKARQPRKLTMSSLIGPNRQTLIVVNRNFDVMVCPTCKLVIIEPSSSNNCRKCKTCSDYFHKNHNKSKFFDFIRSNFSFSI